eukprot:1160524-Pelagomonas_calceolata.AAC.10
MEKHQWCRPNAATMPLAQAGDDNKAHSSKKGRLAPILPKSQCISIGPVTCQLSCMLKRSKLHGGLGTN